MTLLRTIARIAGTALMLAGFGITIAAAVIQPTLLPTWFWATLIATWSVAILGSALQVDFKQMTWAEIGKEMWGMISFTGWPWKRTP